MTPRIGSVCTGYAGLDAAIEDVFGGELAWVADNDKGASKILAHRFPDVPNLGDITAVDWSAVEPVEIMCGGFPCTDVSCAGARAGLVEGTRSGVWTYMARAIGVLRPSLVVIENVRGLLSAKADSDLEWCTWCLGNTDPELAVRALGAVLADLAGLGFDAEWVTVAASDVGAPHKRERVFILAWPAALAAGEGREGRDPAGVRGPDPSSQGQRGAVGPGQRGDVAGHDPRAVPAADAGGGELRRRGGPREVGSGANSAGSEGLQREWAGDAPVGRGQVAADAEREPVRVLAGSLRAAPGTPESPGPERQRLRPDDGDGRAGAAEDPDRAAGGERREPAPGQAEGGRPRADAGGPGGAFAAADAERSQRDRWPDEQVGGPEGRAVARRDSPVSSRGDAPADAGRTGLQVGEVEPDGPELPAAERSDRDGTAAAWCPSCGCPDYFHDLGGFCAGSCGGNCADPELGRPDGGWNSFEDDADPAEVRAYALAHSRGERRDGRESVVGTGRDEAVGEQAGSDGCDGSGTPPADPAGSRLGEQPGGASQPETGPGAGDIAGDRDGERPAVQWGPYEPAIRRWESVLGRPAPRPTEPGRTGERLSPRFVEFMMGLPEGWVTDVTGLSRNDQLKALGNGVVPAQAAYALRLLLTALETEQAA